MLLGVLERLVLFVRPLLLMVSVVSFEARPPRLLSVAHVVLQVAAGFHNAPWFSWS